MVARSDEKIKINVAVLEERVNDVCTDLKEIKENHLPHIYARLGKIENKLAWWAGGIVAATALLDYIFRYTVK